MPDLYRVLQIPQMASYAVVPLNGREFDVRPLTSVWLGEVSNSFVDPYGNVLLALFERLVWRLTHVRAKPHPQAAPLARFLLHLELDDLADEGLDEDLLTEALTAIQPLSRSGEIIGSLMALKNMAQAEEIESIALSSAIPLPMMSPALRPRVMEALRGLVDVATEVQRFRQASSPAVQAAALNRAIGMLEELEGYVGEILVPERRLLALIIDRWQSLVAEAAGRLGARALREMAPAERRALGLDAQDRRATFWSRPAEPFPNPYKTGDPVAPPLFVGRGDIFNRIREVWTGKANPDSIILYGHRRMGKSSILRNLDDYAPPGSLLVYVDLKSEAAFAEGTQHLLLGLAEAVAWAAQDAGHDLPDPAPAAYDTPAEAAQAFKRLLRRAEHALPDKGSVILALDEFEAVDAAVRAGKIGREIYDYLRMLSQRPRLVVVFAGLHTLDEMSRDYREAFFDSYINLPVSYLPPEAAERLIARPTPDFRLDYHADVIAEIIAQTHGQPLLLQRLCQELVNHLNHELFDLEIEREARILPDDLAAVLDDAFVRSETRYFEGDRKSVV